MNISTEALTHALSNKFGKTIVFADVQATQLHGGTLGDVKMITGTATTSNDEKFPYKLVFKTQKKWARYGDPNSWRREYDLYSSELATSFTDSFRWPKCYHAELNSEKTEIQLWMEYIEGVSDLNLTGEMYERVAEAVGRFQGKVYVEKPAFFQKITNLSTVAFVKDFYEHYRSWDKVYHFIRSDNCGIPGHICKMLIDIDAQADEIFQGIDQLPIVLCHRDFWVANIFCTDDEIIAIDWDTCGWGYLGEDVASLIADEVDIEHMVEYYHRSVSAYCKGFAEYVDISYIRNFYVWERIVFLFGYRLVESFINEEPENKVKENEEQKALSLCTLQKIYEMKDMIEGL